MINCILTCVTTPDFTIYVNGERYGYFNGGKGLGRPNFTIPIHTSYGGSKFVHKG